MLILAVAVFAFIMGAIFGYRWCAEVEGRVFQQLADDGQIVVRTDDGWQGTPAAILSLAAWMKGTK